MQRQGNDSIDLSPLIEIVNYLGGHMCEVVNGGFAVNLTITYYEQTKEIVVLKIVTFRSTGSILTTIFH